MADATQADEAQELVVRPARPEDREPVLAFCEHTWSDGDYIASVWDQWLHDERGVLLVGVVEERPVAVVHVRMMSGDEAWLEGIRVDPRERRQGVGRVMTSRALVAARERGATVARLFTASENTASQQLISAFGFTRVAEVVYYDAPALEESALAPDEPEPPVDAGANPNASDGPQLTTPDDSAFERIWAWLVQSNLAPFNGGLEFDSWAARALTEPHLRDYLTQGDVLLLEEWGTILALAIVRAVPAEGDEPAHMQVRYIDGLAESIGRLALVLREVAGERGLARVALWLPDLLILSDAMNGAGYTRQVDGAMWAYSRNL